VGRTREAFLNVTVLNDVGMPPTWSLGNTEGSISTQVGGCTVVGRTEDQRMPVSRDSTIPIKLTQQMPAYTVKHKQMHHAPLKLAK